MNSFKRGPAVLLATVSLSTAIACLAGPSDTHATPSVSDFVIAADAADGSQLRTNSVKFVRQELPQYPQKAWALKASGDTRLSFRINQDGSVSDVVMIGGSDNRALFANAAVHAVRRWRLVWAEPVEEARRATITIRFDASTL